MAKNPYSLFFLGLLTYFTLASFPVIVSGQPPLLFTFGDSSYDVGNTKFFSSEFDPATAWPYGDSVDDPTGRWSDGHIVPDFVGRLIGQGEPIPPVLDPKADLSRGASFAMAGAVVLGSQSKTVTMNFGEQISKFVELHKKWTDKERAEAIYMLNIGADDYLNFAKDHPNANLVEQIAHVANVLSRISRELMKLYKSGGARKLAVQSLGPLGCLPIVRQELKTGESCMEMVNFMVKTHNERLSRVLHAMTVPYRGLRYSFFDFNGEILRRINEPSLHGYTDTTTSCCGTGSRNAFGCGYSNVHSKLCSYQKSFLFFDGRHNTEKTDKEIANLFYSGDKHVVSPVNIRDLVGKSVSYLPAQEI
ncbi:PREDICTED: GDSL esterase/lipase At3g14220-like [Camelina sativa]|uniref:GDSL esterase/lipase At3g14220-like n=1 Tax=Camelina sativa TaxID=90675 RepID=A0ABM0XKA8_CAMSA|nr:PREDICTED: GDSL esterase/lipase At3g14220-like [Camelina sativa]